MAQSLDAVSRQGVSWVRTVNPPAHKALTAGVVASGPALPARR
jgi:hypothetical protein